MINVLTIFFLESIKMGPQHNKMRIGDPEQLQEPQPRAWPTNKMFFLLPRSFIWNPLRYVLSIQDTLINLNRWLPYKQFVYFVILPFNLTSMETFSSI